MTDREAMQLSNEVRAIKKSLGVCEKAIAKLSERLAEIENSTRPDRVQWFAACDGVSRMGPFESQGLAYLALGRAAANPNRSHVWPESR
jgi:hypothetical protein